jgi:hypothetical protein
METGYRADNCASTGESAQRRNMADEATPSLKKIRLHDALAQARQTNSLDPGLLKATKRMILRDEAKQLAFPRRSGGQRIISPPSRKINVQPLDIPLSKFRSTNALLSAVDSSELFARPSDDGGNKEEIEKPILEFQEQFSEDLQLLMSSSLGTQDRPPGPSKTAPVSRRRCISTSHNRTVTSHKLEGIGHHHHNKKYVKKKMRGYFASSIRKHVHLPYSLAADQGGSLSRVSRRPKFGLLYPLKKRR